MPQQSPHTAVALPSGNLAPIIKLIATDVDGTLLNSKQELSIGVGVKDSMLYMCLDSLLIKT
jgi:hypothetical protein